VFETIRSSASVLLPLGIPPSRRLWAACNAGHMDSSLQQLVAHQEINDVLMRYARAIDRVDMDLLRTCYHPGARGDHGPFKGTVEEFVPWVRGLLDQFDSTMQMLGNVLIEFDGDVANAETYCVAYHRLRGKAVDMVLGLRYVDQFERRQDIWRIADRAVVFEWGRTDGVNAFEFTPEYLLGKRDSSDLAYKRLRILTGTIRTVRRASQGCGSGARISREAQRRPNRPGTALSLGSTRSVSAGFDDRAVALLRCLR
jgi:hypothetical protein